MPRLSRPPGRRYRPRASWFAPAVGQRDPRRARVLISRFPNRLLRHGDSRISRVPARSPRYMPCSHQTPVGPERQAIRRSRCCLPQVAQRRLPRIDYFEAQSHGLHRRCLRFAAAVTRTPRKTRFRAVASPTRAGFDPLDLFGRFPKRLISRHLFPLPRALLGARHDSQYRPRHLDQLRRRRCCLSIRRIPGLRRWGPARRELSLLFHFFPH